MCCVRFRYDLGSGPVVIVTDEQVRPNRVHTLRATRAGRNGTLQVDSGAVVAGSSPGTPSSTLNVNDSYWLGGVINILDRYDAILNSNTHTHVVLFLHNLFSRNNFNGIGRFLTLNVLFLVKFYRM